MYPSFVITLSKDYIKSKQYNDLKNIGFNPTIMPGVIPNQDDLNKYKFNGKGAIGCRLAHMNVWKYIIDNNIPKAYIFEDDAYPHDKNKQTFLNSLNNQDKQNYDILKLHFEMPVFGKYGSLAAYIITYNGCKKSLNFKNYFGYIDIDLNLDNKIIIKNTEKNLFWTDESDSNSKSKRYVKEPMIYKLLDKPIDKTSQKKINQLLDYTLIRINNINISTYYVLQIILISLILLFIKVKLKFKILIILIILLLLNI